FAADEEQIADVILHGDVDDILRFLQGDAAAGFGIKFRTGKTAEIAIGIADVRDGELQVAGAAVVEDFAEEFEKAFFGPDNRLGEVRACGGAIRRGCRGGFLGRSQTGGTHYLVNSCILPVKREFKQFYFGTEALNRLGMTEGGLECRRNDGRAAALLRRQLT